MNLICLNTDAMVNLNKQNIHFELLGHNEYSAKLNDNELETFLRINECKLDFLGRIVDISNQFLNQKWGVVITIEGAK